MQLSLLLLQLAGAVLLLLYSTRMVKTGIERASGSALTKMLLKSRNNILLNSTSGLIIAVLLQSSTAVALLVSGFAASGVLMVVAALAIVLGADLGTAIVVQFLSLNLTWLIPAFLTLGGLLFLRSQRRTTKQIGRVLLGIAFILLSLGMISQATIPLRENAYLPSIVAYLSEDVFTAFLGGALLAFIFHSSVATILMLAAFCTQGFLPIEAGIPLVLGANAGGALVPVWLTRGAHFNARRVTGGNFVFRSVGAFAALVALQQYTLPVEQLGADAARQLVNFHFVFNAALVVVCLPLVFLMGKLVVWLVPEELDEGSVLPKPANALDRGILNYPELALAGVTRELLRMGELVEVMFTPVMEMYESDNKEQVSHIKRMDKEVNKAQREIKFYIAELNREELSEKDSERGMELTSIAIHLERIGDIIAKELLGLTQEKHKKAVSFSPEGWAELTALHAQVKINMQLALNVLVSEDLDSARQLIEEKDRMRELERDSHNAHLARLCEGSPLSIATSDIHLETARALKEINSKFAAFAFPILDRNGELLESRLAEQES